MTQAPNYFSSASRSLFFLYSFSILSLSSIPFPQKALPPDLLLYPSSEGRFPVYCTTPEVALYARGPHLPARRWVQVGKGWWPKVTCWLPRARVRRERHARICATAQMTASL